MIIIFSKFTESVPAIRRKIIAEAEEIIIVDNRRKLVWKLVQCL